MARNQVEEWTPQRTIEGHAINPQTLPAKAETYGLSDLWFDVLPPLYMAITGWGIFGPLLIYETWQNYYAAIEYWRHHGPNPYPEAPDFPLWVYGSILPAVLFGIVFFNQFYVRMSTKRGRSEAAAKPWPVYTDDIHGDADWDDYINSVRALRADEHVGDGPEYPN